MSVPTLVLGPWQLRHGEPLSPSAPGLELAVLSSLDLSCRSLVVDRRDFGGVDDLFCAYRMPLAAIVDNDGQPSIAYLLHALDGNRALLFRVEEPPGTDDCLDRRIARLFESRHLQLNNNECYYVAAAQAEIIRAVDGDQSYWTLGFHVHALLDDGALRPFMPQFRTAARVRYVDVEAFVLDTATDDGACFVLVYDCARRRSSWDKRPVTIESISLSEAGTCKRHRSGEIDPDGSGRDRMVAAFTGRQARPQARWRRLAVEIPCESLYSGNLFTVSLEDCQPLQAGRDRRMFARIRYEKTRGNQVMHHVADDLERLTDSISAALEGHGVHVVAGRDMLAEMVDVEAHE
jgi:hypothetical protein